jgi:putative sugar O-methyltransferase
MKKIKPSSRIKLISADFIRIILPTDLIARLKKNLEYLSQGGKSLDPIEGYVVESLENIPDKEEQIVSALINSFTYSKAHQINVSMPYQPGADWAKLLCQEWKDKYVLIQNKDLKKLSHLLRNFFRNEFLSGFWGNDKMFSKFLDGGWGRAFGMHQQYKAWRDLFPEADISDLAAPLIGNPWGYVIEGNLLYEPVFEYYYHANLIQKLLKPIEKPVIVEIGGGFGGLAFHIIKKMPNAKYIAFDLPENILLQGYYLQCAYPEARIMCYSASSIIYDEIVIDDFDIILMPNFMLPKMPQSIADLVVNIRSLSELPIDTIRAYISEIDRIGKLYFFHENIFKSRLDGLSGVPVPDFPGLTNFCHVYEAESKWPRYGKSSDYPCREYLYMHRSLIPRQD